MADPFSQIFSPVGFQELFSIWDNLPDAKLCAGGMKLVRSHGGGVPILPHNIITLNKMEDLHKISRTERYLEIGAMVKLSQIVDLGKIVPEALTECIKCIGGPQQRNLITIGGNICNLSHRFDCAAPMVALDAQFELRSALSSRWINASRFLTLKDPMAASEILSRIRIPLEPWTFTRYLKLRNPETNSSGGGILFIMRNQKNILTHIRVVYSGQSILREKTCETMLEGKRLPLERRSAEYFLNTWKTYLSFLPYLFNSEETKGSQWAKRCSNPELVKTQILNFIKNTIANISE
jgi:CO/xanthine dehydrogenase FAD-binding subunit